MDCINCGKCQIFKKNPSRFECCNCVCPNYRHKSYIETQMKNCQHLTSWIQNITTTSISQLADYKSAMEMAKRKRLAWLPIGLNENTISKFIQTYDKLLAMHGSNSNILTRAMKIAFQIPLGDCNINVSSSAFDQSELDPVSESEYNFKNFRDINCLRFGEVKGVDCNEACFSCKRQFVTSDQFCVALVQSGNLSFHVACFKCFQCKGSLVDFHYYWSKEQNNVYCLRHFDDLDKSRCAGCDEMIFNLQFINAMEKCYHVEHFTCIRCNTTFGEEKYIFQDDGPCCLKCYENKCAHVCDRCALKIDIEMKEMIFDDRFWHDTCFYCETCKTSLSNQKFSTKNMLLYCSSCYDDNFAPRCQGCCKPITGIAKTSGNGDKQWHEDCIVCGICKESIKNTSFVQKDSCNMCIHCYETKYGKKCFKCKQLIKVGGIVYKGSAFHKQCFLCTKCNKVLAGTSFASQDDKPYCKDCFAELFSKQCKKCKKAISGFGDGKFVTVDDDNWHSECFKCAKCDVMLLGKGYMKPKQEILCSRCCLLDSLKK